MEDDELVSIVIPIGPSSHLLPLTLKSVFEQTYDKIEVIVVGEAEGLDSRVKYIRFLGNRSQAKNIGVINARGEYVLFLDSDQLMTRNAVEECIKAGKNVDMVKIPEVFLGITFWEKCSAIWKDMVEKIDGGIPRFYKRRDVLSFGLFQPLSLWEDLDLYQRLRERGRKDGWCKARIVHVEPYTNLQILKAFTYGSSLSSSIKVRGASTLLDKLVLSIRVSAAILRSRIDLRLKLGSLFFAFIKGLVHILGLFLSPFKRK